LQPRIGFIGTKQVEFDDYEQATAMKRTRRERFLGEMKKVVPWEALFELIETHYPKTSSKGGRPPYPLATMRRIHLLLQLCNLSDPAMEDALIDVPTMRRFAWIDMISDRIPVETTILAFRHLLEKHDLGQRIFEVEAHHNVNGMGMKQGTIIEATLIDATSSTFRRVKPERAGGTGKKASSGILRCIRPRRATSLISALKSKQAWTMTQV
jgi:IS5 family transposase